MTENNEKPYLYFEKINQALNKSELDYRHA